MQCIRLLFLCCRIRKNVMHKIVISLLQISPWLIKSQFIKCHKSTRQLCNYIQRNKLGVFIFYGMHPLLSNPHRHLQFQTCQLLHQCQLLLPPLVPSLLQQRLQRLPQQQHLQQNRHLQVLQEKWSVWQRFRDWRGSLRKWWGKKPRLRCYQ